MNERPGELPRPANIADPFWDLLLPLDEARRQGFIRRLAIGFYENWRRQGKKSRTSWTSNWDG